MPDNITPLRQPLPCPQCQKNSHRNFYPFCSKRCADLDLGAWLKGSYKIAASTDEDDFSTGESSD